MTPDDLKWREARREHIATALCAALIAVGENYTRSISYGMELAEELIAALDKRAQEERAANDAS